MNYVAKDIRADSGGLAGSSAAAQKVVNLGLQGGGSHGAFTWGVLDRLLEEERLTFEGVSASSAGAINAVLLADGFAAGGREGAKNSLRRFWRKMSELGGSGIFQPSLIDSADLSFGLDHSPGYLFMEALSYYLSPYQFNPFNYNPLKTLLGETIDFARVREQQDIKLFLTATNVETARVKVFQGKELHAEHVLASSCLPLLMQAVEIDRQYYWDGGFVGHPAIYPLIRECAARDIVVVHITPSERPGVPKTSPAIMNRMQEISFNAAHFREMRSLAYISELVDSGKAEGRRPFVHMIEADDITRSLSPSSRVNSNWKFLLHLHALGRQRAEEWLTGNFAQVGVESTVDLRAKYL
jgi:NTE family protein